MITNGYIQAQCDFGNPGGSGLAAVHLPDMSVEDYSSVQTKLGAFHAAVKAAQLTGSNAGDLGNTYVSESTASRPEASINTDRRLVASYRTTGNRSVRRITIPGVPTTSTGISQEDAGERLNSVGKAALAAALEAAYGLTAGDVVILSGKVVQKS